MRHRFVTSLAVLACLAAPGVARSVQLSEPHRAPSAPRAVGHAVVEADGLAAILEIEHLVVLDVRDTEAYAKAHLPDALQLTESEWKDDSLAQDSGLSHDEAWQRRLGELGITPSTPVLIYDDGNMTSAARIWFILQHFGVPRAMVVNGGYPLIEQHADSDGIELTTEPARPTPKDFKAARVTGDAVVGLVERDELRQLIDRGAVQVFDARSTEEYAGEKLLSNTRGGHLPGAVNLPHTELLDDQGRLRSPEELDRLLADAGFVKGVPVITHCQSGGRAALAALAAARAGYGPVRNYYLSFGDWVADATCPLVTTD